MTRLTRTALSLAITAALAIPAFAEIPGLNAPIGAGSSSSAPHSTSNTPLSIGTASNKVPMGTLLEIRFNNALDARITEIGEPFTATLVDDFATPGTPDAQGNPRRERIILPAGTAIRGRVANIRRPSWFSKGGAITLQFDHIVLPSGETLPIQLTLSPKATQVNHQVNTAGEFYADPGIPVKLRKGLDKGVGVFDKFKNAGVDAGKDLGDGLGTIVTVPVAVAGGAIAGAAVTTGQAAVAVVGKGDTVILNPGDTVTVDFGGSFNLPSE